MKEFHSRYEQARDIEFWRQLNPHLHLTDQTVPLSTEAVHLDSGTIDKLKASLKNDGYFQVHHFLDKQCTRPLAAGVENIFKAGWPTPFVIVYDEVWKMLHSMRMLLSEVMGEGYQQIPKFWCWYVDTNYESKGGGHHRDRPGAASVLDDGKTGSLTTWIALSDANPSNGCIYILPGSNDPDYPENPQRKTIEDYQKIRALPADEGDISAWTETLLHWDSRSSNSAINPPISMSFTFQRADQHPYELPIYETHRYPSFDERLGLIAQNVCNYQSNAPTTPEILFACRRLSGLIPSISHQNNIERQVFEVDKKLSDSAIWKFQEQSESLNALEKKPFGITTRMPFVACYQEIVTAFLLDCAKVLDFEQPIYILDISGGSGCFALRFLNEFLESKQDFELLKKLNFKYVLSDFSESRVKNLSRNRVLARFKDAGILDFAAFRPESDHSIKLLVSKETLASSSLKNPLIVLANYVFDTIKQDAFRVIKGTLQETRFTLFRDSGNCSLSEEVRLEHLQTIERYLDVDGAYYYGDPALDSILEHYRTNLEEGNIIFPIGALKSIQNLSELSGGKLALLAADKGFASLASHRIKNLKPHEFLDRNGLSFDVNFDAIVKYFETQGGSSFVENGDHAQLSIMFGTTLNAPLELTKHFCRQQLQDKRLLQSEEHLEGMVTNLIRPEEDTELSVKSFLSVLRAFNFETAIFSRAYAVLLDPKLQQLHAIDGQLQDDLLEVSLRASKNVYLEDSDSNVLDKILRTCFAIRRYSDCLNISKNFIESFGEVRTALHHAAFCFVEMGDYQLAHDYFRRAFLKDETNTWAYNEMLRMRTLLVESGKSTVRVTISEQS
jgi:Phytanoyl-CoA dioxygenase (PhyH)